MLPRGDNGPNVPRHNISGKQKNVFFPLSCSVADLPQVENRAIFLQRNKIYMICIYNLNLKRDCLQGDKQSDKLYLKVLNNNLIALDPRNEFLSLYKRCECFNFCTYGHIFMRDHSMLTCLHVDRSRAVLIASQFSKCLQLECPCHLADYPFVQELDCTVPSNQVTT